MKNKLVIIGLALTLILTLIGYARVAKVLAVNAKTESRTSTPSSLASSTSTEPVEEAPKINVVTTIFPEYDWVREIAKDKANVTVLADSGVDLHSFQPTAQDIVTLSKADMFIYVGGESDAWVEPALKSIENDKLVVINLMDVLANDIKEEEIVEGMEHEHEEAEAEEEHEYDEHVWLSLKNAISCVDYITDKLVDIDKQNTDFYKENHDTYTEKLSDLDSRYKIVVDAAPVKTLLFGDRFPFRYMVDDYGLGYYAAFAGCSAESEASFETITFLASKVDELNLKVICTIENSDGKIAESIKNTSQSKDARFVALNSIQNISSKDIKNGVTYLSIMENNLDMLKSALN